MILRQRLDQRQVQKLILAPALQQAIKLLPLTNLELVDVINEEIAQNPMIEIADEAPDRDGSQETSQAEEMPPKEDPVRERKDPEMDGPETSEMYEAGFQEYLDDGFHPRFDSEKREAVQMENCLSSSPSLYDHLDWQASLTFSDPEDREIAVRIIGDINEDGYLTTSSEELAALCRTTPERVESIRLKIKGFDPIGCGSLNLGETLIAQLDQFPEIDDIARRIIKECSPLLERSDFAQISKHFEIPFDELRTHIDLIKSLDPAPGRKYNQEKTNYVVPDLTAEKVGDDWVVTLNDEGLPHLRISQYYRQLLARAAKTQPEASLFLKENLKKALWFLRSLDQRNQTIYKVARHIVDRQKDFLEKGMEYLKPMTLIEVARVVGVHESTVGRVVANKHIQTPLGVMSLKYFFHKSIPSGLGEDVSSRLIKEKVRKLVDAENKTRPFSDIDIRTELAREGLQIARRTVTKYREQLGIEPSHIRKRKYEMEGPK